MEKMNSKFTWPISEPIKVAYFQESWRDLFKQSLNSWSERISRKLDQETESFESGTIVTVSNDGNLKSSPECLLELIPNDLMEELENKCDLETLKCSEETTDYIFANQKLSTNDGQFLQIPKNHGLITLTMQENDLKQRFKDLNYRKQLRRGMKHKNAELLLLPKSHVDHNVDETSQDNVAEISPDEVILSVTVCRQSKNYAKYSVRRGGTKYFVLSSQKLTELRDAITCSADIQPTGDFSRNPHMENVEIAKDKYKSAFFFINGTFYNDMRDPDSRDNSEVIRDWIKVNSEILTKFGDCSTKLMDETTFDDLEIKLGYCYLYMHQGECEHFVIFDDIRLINDSDSKDRMRYPLCYSTKKDKGLRCMLCCAFPPKWITKNHDRVHADPFLFCDNCFHGFNYDDQGRKIGRFEAHPYVNL